MSLVKTHPVDTYPQAEAAREDAMSREERGEHVREQVRLYRVASAWEAAMSMKAGIPEANLRSSTGGPIDADAHRFKKAPFGEWARWSNSLHPTKTGVTANDPLDAQIDAALRLDGDTRFTSGGSGYSVDAGTGTHHPADFPRGVNSLTNRLYDFALMNSSPAFFAYTGEGDELADFNEFTTVNVSSPSQMGRLGDALPFPRTTLNMEQADAAKIARYGQSVALSPMLLANDGVKAIQRAANAQIEAANGTVTMVCVGVLVRPDSLVDGIDRPLFHADRGNLNTVMGGAPSITTWDAMNALMAAQKKPDGNAFFDCRPRICLVPPTLEPGARQAFAPAALGPSVRVSPTGEMIRENIDVISEPELAFYDSRAWYSLADPKLYPTIVRVYFQGWGWQGRRETWTERETGSLCMSFEQRVGVAVQNYRTAVRNPGQ